MGTLRVRLFGRLHIEHDDFPIEETLCQPAQGLLAYLLLYRDRPHPREALAGLFWGDRSDYRARRCLSTTLWRLRRILEPPDHVPRGTYLLDADDGELGFNCHSDYWLDVAQFEAGARRILGNGRDRPDEVQPLHLQDMLGLCTRDLLEGCYDDWALRERERLRLLYLRSLRRLMRVHRERGALEDSLACAQQILACDPLREEIHREVMRLHCDLGQRSLAVRQYRHCREILADELGIPPMEETQALYARIAGNGQAEPGQVIVAGHGDFRQAVQLLREALDESALVQARLRQAVAQVERLLAQTSSHR